jgi:hypothetical protein
MSTVVPVTFVPRPLHPRRGIHAPRPSIPHRPPGSVRRTSTIDTIRPGDIVGDAIQIGRARDLRTDSDGSSVVLGQATVRTRLAYTENFRLLELACDPPRPALDVLIGRSVSTGFRAAMIDAVPAEEEQATLLHLLLDDLPGAALVSGYAIGHAGGYSQRPPDPDRMVLQVAGLCAGFQHGGTIMREIEKGRTPPVVTGPLATPIVPEDPLCWHELREMGGNDMRRWRLLDVLPGATPDDPIEVEAYFRDSHLAPDGAETVIHEYTVAVRVDPATERIIDSTAEAHSLPWLECIEAEDSGTRLAGRALRGLRPNVREEFTGVTTCTHLNDTMRSIEDVRALLPLLAR